MNYIFLFDLDGTIVLTDSIYFRVWKQILETYHLTLTEELFDRSIRGNNDETALSKLLPTIYQQQLQTVMRLKDELFYKYIQEIRLVKGVDTFIRMLHSKGYPIAVVSNSNRPIAEFILKYIGLSEYINMIFIGNECDKPKPYPDPYLRAIQHFQSTPQNAFIFEDSKAGIQSARTVSPKCIVGIETSYPSAILKELGVDISISDFTTIEIEYIIK